MSEQTSETRSPDSFVKRAPTASTNIAVGTTTSTAALLAYYLNQCLTAKHLVVPSTEMILILLGYLYPLAVTAKKFASAWLQNIAKREGVDLDENGEPG